MATNGNNYGLFWESVDQDRVYGADSFEMLFKRFFTTGVFLNDFQTTATTGMFVQVGGSDDYANIEGKVYKTVATNELSLQAAHSTYPRIDTVVIARDNQTRRFTISIVKGAYSGQNPVPTAPIRNSTRYELVLAQIRVKAGATSITQADITDTRANKDLCGIVACAVEEYDFEQWSAKFDADFADWFNNVKDNLSEDAAGHLQNEIDSLVESLNASGIAYSNTTSGLTATKVQGAIDEVNSKVENTKTRVTNIENQLTDNGETIFVQKRNGKWGYNTSSNRGADTFTPFRMGLAGAKELGSLGGTFDVSNYRDYREFTTTGNFFVVLSSVNYSGGSGSYKVAGHWGGDSDDWNGFSAAAINIENLLSYNAATGVLTTKNSASGSVSGSGSSPHDSGSASTTATLTVTGKVYLLE